MSQQDKSRFYKALQEAGVAFTKHYREYTTAELEGAYNRLVAQQNAAAPVAPSPAPDAEAAAFFGFQEEAAQPPVVPVMPKDHNEMAGARQNTNRADEEPIRIDPETGIMWFQEEVRKPDYPKPRGRRVLKYKDPGVVETTVKAGDYTETFEISGDMSRAREAEVKITLPSFQVGIYKDPRFPFKVVCYNGNEGFALEDIENFYGGAELVNSGCRRKYVENVLCYDIRSVVRSIEYEARQLALQQGQVARG